MSYNKEAYPRPVDIKWQNIRKSDSLKKYIDSYEDSKSVVNKMSIQERAYLAGIVDGEGCIGAYVFRKGSSIQKRIDITNTNYRLMEWISYKVPFFKITMSATYSKKHKPGYHAKIDCSEKIKALLDCIFPFLVIKKEQAQLLSYLCSMRWNKRTKVSKECFSIAKRIKLLNRKGLK